jgi:hypothetical protein
MGTVFDGTHSFKLRKGDEACTFIHKDLLIAVKVFAKKRGISIREATSILILEGLKHLWKPD